MSLLDRFRGTRTPSTDFAAVRSDMQSTPLFVDVDLTNARALSNATALDLPINGNVIYIDQKANSGFASLHFNDDAMKGNTGFTAFPGFVARVPYTKLVIENSAQPGMTLRIIYGVDIDFQPAVSAGVFGEVSVVDGGKARTLSNVAFMGRATVGLIAAQYSYCQVLNPAGSGRNVFISQFDSVSVSAACTVSLFEYSVALTDDLGNPPSKLIGAAGLSVAQMRRMNSASILGTGFPLAQSDLLAATPFTIALREPLSLAPGLGIIWRTNTVNIALSMTAELWEEA